MRPKTLLSGVRPRRRTIACNNQVTREYLPPPMGRQSSSGAIGRHSRPQIFSPPLLIAQPAMTTRGLAIVARRVIVGLGYAAHRLISNRAMEDTSCRDISV